MTQRAAATHGKLQWVRADGSWHASGRSAESARSYHVYQERQSFQATVREGGQTYDLGIHKSAEAAKGAAEEYEKRYAVAAEAGRVGRGEKIKEITVGLPGNEALIEVYKNEVNRYTPFVTWGSGFGVEGERQETLKDAIAEGRRIADAGPAAGVEATECATCPAEITAAKNCMPNADSLIRQAETKLTYGEREADVHVWLQHEGCDADQAFLILAAAKILAADVAQVGIESTVPTSDVHPQSTSEPCGPCALEAVARDFNTQDEALSHAASHGFTHYVKKGRKFLVFGQGPDGTTSSARMYRHKGKYHFTEAKLSKDPMPKRAKALASVSSEPAAPDHRVVRAESHRGVSYKVFQDFEDKDGTYSVVIEGGAHNGGAGWHQDGYKTVEDADAAAKASIDAYPEHYGAEPSTAMVVAQSTAAVVAEDRHYDDFRWDIPLDEQNAGRWVEAPLLGTWLTAYYQAPAEGGGYWVQFDPDSPYRRVSHIREIGAQVDPWGQPMPSKPAAPPEQITDAMRASVMARMVKAGGELPVGQLSDQDRAILAAIAPEYVETDGEVFRITNKGRKWLGTRKKVHAWAAARENDSVSCFPPPIPLWQHPECIPSNPATWQLNEASARRFADVRAMLLDGLQAHGWSVARNLKVPHATSPDGQTRLWFKTQAIYMNDVGTDPRQFANAHSLAYDMREYQSVDELLAGIKTDIDRDPNEESMFEARAGRRTRAPMWNGTLTQLGAYEIATDPTEGYWYETMVFGPNDREVDGFTSRYPNEKEARAGHEETVERVRSAFNLQVERRDIARERENPIAVRAPVVRERGLVWLQRPDGIYWANATGGTYWLMPQPSGDYQTTWMAVDGDQQDLGIHPLPEAYQAAQHFDPVSKQQWAAESGRQEPTEAQLEWMEHIIRREAFRASGQDPYAYLRPEEMDQRVLQGLTSRGWVETRTFRSKVRGKNFQYVTVTDRGRAALERAGSQVQGSVASAPVRDDSRWQRPLDGNTSVEWMKQGVYKGALYQIVSGRHGDQLMWGYNAYTPNGLQRSGLVFHTRKEAMYVMKSYLDREQHVASEQWTRPRHAEPGHWYRVTYVDSTQRWAKPGTWDVHARDRQHAQALFNEHALPSWELLRINHSPIEHNSRPYTRPVAEAGHGTFRYRAIHYDVYAADGGYRYVLHFPEAPPVVGSVLPDYAQAADAARAAIDEHEDAFAFREEEIEGIPTEIVPDVVPEPEPHLPPMMPPAPHPLPQLPPGAYPSPAFRAAEAARRPPFAGAPPGTRGRRHLPVINYAVIVGPANDKDTLRIRQFLSRSGQSFKFYDTETDPDAKQLIEEYRIRADALPSVIWKDIVLTRPSNRKLADVIGFGTRAEGDQSYDVVIVGAGPAGLSAAVYAASEGLTCAVVEMYAPGGQAANSSKIENYAGFPQGISGADLAALTYNQALKFGAHFIIPADAKRLLKNSSGFEVRMSDNSRVHGKTVILACGLQWKKPEYQNLPKFEGVGVYYAATATEASYVKSQDVAVVGGGNSAGQAAMYLSGIARKVYLIVRKSGLADTMSHYLVERIEHTKNIELLPFTEITKLEGGAHLESVTWDQAGKTRTEPVRHVFLMIGSVPNTDWVSQCTPSSKWVEDCVALDFAGYIKTGAEDLRDVWKRGEHGRDPFPFETSMAWCFAAGDIRLGSTKRVATAVGEGAVAVGSVHKALYERAHRHAAE